jgi:hypothetical protein
MLLNIFKRAKYSLFLSRDVNDGIGLKTDILTAIQFKGLIAAISFEF